MTWTCAALDHAITFFSNNKIAPCCVINHSYRKNISDLKKGNPFADLKNLIKETNQAPVECKVCIDNENNKLASYRQRFNSQKQSLDGYQFIDVRNSNLCNLSCRMCGPHSSSLWAKELGGNLNQDTDISSYFDIIINDSVQEIYFTGGEPLLNLSHWAILDEYINQGKSKNVALRYNSNLTTLRYKNKSIFEYWKHFKSIEYNASIDAVGEKLNNLRSGANWLTIEKNIKEVVAYQKQVGNLQFIVHNVISNLNVWFLVEYLQYFINLKTKISLDILRFPDYYALDCLPFELIDLAKEQITQALNLPLPIENKNQLAYAKYKIETNQGKSLFINTISTVLLLDKIRKENLFDDLPFSQIAYKQVTNNNG